MAKLNINNTYSSGLLAATKDKVEREVVDLIGWRQSKQGLEMGKIPSVLEPVITALAFITKRENARRAANGIESKTTKGEVLNAVFDPGNEAIVFDEMAAEKYERGAKRAAAYSGLVTYEDLQQTFQWGCGVLIGASKNATDAKGNPIFDSDSEYESHFSNALAE